MNPFAYYQTLNKKEKENYASRSGSTFGYLNTHVFSRSGPRKRIGNELVVSFHIESEGNVSLDEAIDYFLVQPVKKLAKEIQQAEQGANKSLEDQAA